MRDLNWNQSNTVVVSGIGCSGRASGYFNTDAIHTTHGRALPVAEGIKLANEKTNVLVISGDGDLLSIGGNHLIHTARRNSNLTVICNRNDVYGMTGGQLAPTTSADEPTKTTPHGSGIEPLSVESIITGYKKHFYAKTSVVDVKHLRDSIFAALTWDGFAFVEVLSICPTQRGSNLGLSPAELNDFLKKQIDRDPDMKLKIRYNS
ncbi:2-oxoacid:ferredoxin oxidoreductase subunit beta [Candidatus Dojkabacteria bacterium]|nr:2-oxoacid:ferredoxin oxidoreductase subunit beta [Candidatus Dojkabacteria bacterium]